MDIPETLYKNPAPISVDVSVTNLMDDELTPFMDLNTVSVRVRIECKNAH